MRGIAVFFLILSVLAGLQSLVAIFSEQPNNISDETFGYLLRGLGFFAGGIAAWHGSRLGAASIIFLLVLSAWAVSVSNVSYSMVDWLRAALYIGLATLMTVSAVRYVAASQAQDLDIGGHEVVRWGGKIVNGIVLAFVGLGVAVIVNGATIAVLKASQIEEDHIIWLTDQHYLWNDEKPLYL